jgi:DNA replication protein DnaC
MGWYYMLKAGLPKAAVGQTFSSYDVTDQNMGLFDAVVGWGLSDKNFLALLSKQTGIGKTHLAVASMFHHWVSNADICFRAYPAAPPRPSVTNKQYIFVKESDLIDTLQESFSDDTPYTKKDVMDRLKSVDFLVVDDMFSHKKSDFDRQVIFDLVDVRMGFPDKRTIVTSNLGLDDIENIDSRISSRLSDMRTGTACDVVNQIDDYRVQRHSSITKL